MIIVEERPLLTAPAVGVTPAGEHPADQPAHTDSPDRADSSGLTDRADRTELPGTTAAEDTSTALAMASIRISRGNPTAEETAALAALLTARLRLLNEARQPVPSTPRTRKLPTQTCRPFRAPGAWAS
ncbi:MULTISPECIES: acyl-CoA carboxylase epsilon subunit [unclassified Streptomyces]|uniref:acyl-CoA carboxylase epsilon subunit n=1 Tax=unclassified Streptomyces TaxID=2593676 RepID=UPI002259A0E0|nr:acyl-CoA carboxylase epsilon subunit [Streptomyces sp. NBC_00047]MCX5612938.1 acyl-CoA carboxylase epsilon subunit [Streptomyces sp. NBC_00047]